MMEGGNPGPLSSIPSIVRERETEAVRDAEVTPTNPRWGQKVIFTMLGTGVLLQSGEKTNMDMSNRSQSRRGPFCLAGKGRVSDKTRKGRLTLNLH